MKKSDSKTSHETLEEELKRLRKKVARLERKNEAAKTKIEDMRRELKKKEEPKPVFSKEQWMCISSLLKDIDTQSK